jgi:hypothetical protein
MRKEVQGTADRFVQELQVHHPGITVELLDGATPWVDALVRVKCASHDQVDDVAETLARLTTDYYLDEGVYIAGSAYFSGPLLTVNR